MARRRVNSRRTRNRWWSGTVHLASLRAAAIRARPASNERRMPMPRVNAINAMNSLPNRVLPHPVIFAKRLATIDVLSEGRMRLLTVGLGTLPGEARALGVDFGSRGRRADEAIDVLRLLWAGDGRGVSFEGEFFSLSTTSQAFPGRTRAQRSRFISADQAARQRDGRACGVTATSREVGSAQPREQPSSNSCGRPCARLGGIRARLSTPAGRRSTCPRTMSRDSPRREWCAWLSAERHLSRQQQLDEMSELAERVRLRS